MVCLMHSGKLKRSKLERGKLNRSSLNTFNRKMYGFTLVELLVVLAIIALLLTIASPKYFNSIEKSKDATLKQSLNVVRESIDKFYADKGQYPKKLEDLVEQKYIRKLPVDPITESSETWILEAPESPLEGDIADIHSGALGAAIDGTPYVSW